MAQGREERIETGPPSHRLALAIGIETVKVGGGAATILRGELTL